MVENRKTPQDVAGAQWFPSRRYDLFVEKVALSYYRKSARGRDVAGFPGVPPLPLTSDQIFPWRKKHD